MDGGQNAVCNLAAGTQAPPVDAPKRGRPRIHADRKADNAQKQREYRKRRAAAKEKQ